MTDEVTPEIEVQAQEHGWQPEESFKADPKNAGKKWRPAEEFMDRKSLFDKIEDQNKEIRNLKRGMDSFADHNRRIETIAYEKALATLKAEREQALEDGELVKAEKIRDKIDDLKAAPPVTPQVQKEAPEFTEWKKANDWYLSDDDMTAWADAKGSKLAKQGMTPPEVLKEITKQAKSLFPAKFRNPNKDSDAPVVEAGKQRVARGDGFKLTADEEKAIDNMIKAGAPITKEKYIADIKKSRGL